ncbi:unnamed protein product, partial [Polarella glacialis]
PPGVRGQSPVARAAFDLGKTVSGMFGGGEDEASQFAVPKDVAALVEGLKSSTEASLNLRCSRLDVEIPPAYKLGVEGDKKKGRLLVDKINADDEEVARSDRELARVFVEMFLEIGPGLMIVFRNKALATAARATWKLETKTEGRVISFPETPKSAFAAEVGVPAKFMQKLTEGGCKCLIVVGPYMEQLRLIEEIGNQVQDQMGIILLNSRIHGKDRITEKKFPARLRASLQQTYTPSYHVRFLERKNGILFRMVGADGKAPWIVAQQKELFGGQPVTQEVLRSDQEPSAAEIRAAFQSALFAVVAFTAAFEFAMPTVRRARKNLSEYQGWPKGIYPMSDGWVPPCYPNEEELIEYEEKMNARRKATLVKRHICVKEQQYEQLSKKEFAEKSEYSLLAFPISEGDYSGEGDDKTYFLIVFYEPSKKSKVERAFKSVGNDLTEYEQVVVDPDAKEDAEEKFMWAHGEGNAGECILSEFEYQVTEKGTAEYDDPWGPTHPEGKFWE